MKIITLNTWGGRAGVDLLLPFFEKHKDVDIFCLQEVFSGGEKENSEMAEDTAGKVYNLFPFIEAKLSPLFTGYFRPNLGNWYGLAIFAKKQLQVLAEGDVLVHGERDFVPTDGLGRHSRTLQYLTLDTPSGKQTIINFHGLWTGGGKNDAPERLKQSEKIISFLKTVDHPYILCGDFNLNPETESLKMLEDLGLRNLIKEHGVQSTRTSFYTKPEKFADYVLVHPEIKVNDFRVLPDEVSDHSPLFVDFE